ncbi:hypothetical protein Bbelb_206560 [Branchiostoma belcheri]|nr:hypothetical protein Bbelb_206560 [Branchiostoma belcheri]
MSIRLDNCFPVGGEPKVMTWTARSSSAYGHLTDTVQLKWVFDVRDITSGVCPDMSWVRLGIELGTPGAPSLRGLRGQYTSNNVTTTHFSPTGRETPPDGHSVTTSAGQRPSKGKTLLSGYQEAQKIETPVRKTYALTTTTVHPRGQEKQTVLIGFLQKNMASGGRQAVWCLLLFASINLHLDRKRPNFASTGRWYGRGAILPKGKIIADSAPPHDRQSYVNGSP